MRDMDIGYGCSSDGEKEWWGFYHNEEGGLIYFSNEASVLALYSEVKEYLTTDHWYYKDPQKFILPREFFE